MAITTTQKLDRYNYAIGGNWDKAAEDPKIKAFNEILRQEAFERQRIRIQAEMKLQKVIPKNKGRISVKSELIKGLIKQYPWGTNLWYKKKNGKIVKRKVNSAWWEVDEGKAACVALTTTGTKTTILANSVIRRTNKDDVKRKGKYE